MSNEPLRRAIEAANSTLEDIAERLDVDPKTVWRWINRGVLPYARHRRALAALLHVDERGLWTPAEHGSQAEALWGLRRQLAESQTEIERLRDEIAEYEDFLKSHVFGWPVPVRVRRRVIVYEIGDIPNGDSSTETYEMEAIEADKPIRFYTISTGSLGDGIPPKRSSRELGRRVYEELPNGKHRMLKYLAVGGKYGRLRTIVKFERKITVRSPRRWGYHESWEGIWNPLRREHVDSAVLHLDQEGDLTTWDLIVVCFRFPAAAREPHVGVDGDTPPLPLEQSQSADGRVSFAFRIEPAEHRSYEWYLTVGGFGPSTRPEFSA